MDRTRILLCVQILIMKTNNGSNYKPYRYKIRSLENSVVSFLGYQVKRLVVRSIGYRLKSWYCRYIYQYQKALYS